MGTCPTCGDTFDTTAGMKRHHALAHNESIAGVEVECDVCGETTRKRPHEVADHDRSVCSKECRKSLLSRLSSGENNPTYSGGKTEYDCYTCGDPVHRWASTVPNPDRVFCSTACQGEWVSEFFEGRRSPRWNSHEIPCDRCDDTLVRSESHIERHDYHFCSNTCKDEHHSELVSGEGNPNYRHGASGSIVYGAEWETVRSDILERDGRECSLCGMDQPGHRERFGQGLQVHHIEPIAEFDTPEEANRHTNLITLCGPCHGQVEHGSGNLRDRLEVVARARTRP